MSLDVAISSVAEYQNADDFRLDRDQITTIRVLGSGNFGQVFKAVYGPSRAEVAVKSLKGTFYHAMKSYNKNDKYMIFIYSFFQHWQFSVFLIYLNLYFTSRLELSKRYLR